MRQKLANIDLMPTFSEQLKMIENQSSSILLVKCAIIGWRCQSKSHREGIFHGRFLHYWEKFVTVLCDLFQIHAKKQFWPDLWSFLDPFHSLLPTANVIESKLNCDLVRLIPLYLLTISLPNINCFDLTETALLSIIITVVTITIFYLLIRDFNLLRHRFFLNFNSKERKRNTSHEKKVDSLNSVGIILLSPILS